MKWVFDNFQVIILIGGAIAYWLNQRKREKEGLPADYDEDGVPENRPTRTDFDPSTMDADEAERTRRLQEEMRRKREQRSAGSPASPFQRAEEAVPPLPAPSPAPARRESSPPPVFQDPMAELMKELTRKLAPPPVPAAPAPAPVRMALEDEEALENQRRLQSEFAALEAKKRALHKQRADLATRSAASQPMVSQEYASPVGSWLADLRDVNKVRRALVMNEILGKPVALRD